MKLLSFCKIACIDKSFDNQRIQRFDVTSLSKDYLPPPVFQGSFRFNELKHVIAIAITFLSMWQVTMLTSLMFPLFILETHKALIGLCNYRLVNALRTKLEINMLFSLLTTPLRSNLKCFFTRILTLLWYRLYQHSNS